MIHGKVAEVTIEKDDGDNSVTILCEDRFGPVQIKGLSRKEMQRMAAAFDQFVTIQFFTPQDGQEVAE